MKKISLLASTILSLSFSMPFFAQDAHDKEGQPSASSGQAAPRIENVDDLTPGVPHGLFYSSVAHFVSKNAIAELPKTLHKKGEGKSDELIGSLFTGISSYVSAHGAEKMGDQEMRPTVAVFYALHNIAYESSQAKVQKAKQMCVYVGALKKEFIPEYKWEKTSLNMPEDFLATPEKRKAFHTAWAAEQKTKSDKNAKQCLLEKELPRIKSATMDAILTAFTKEDAKKMSPDLKFCIEKANLTANDKKELLFGLKTGLTRWNEITHPDDIAAERKRDEEHRKFREEVLKNKKK